MTIFHLNSPLIRTEGKKKDGKKSSQQITLTITIVLLKQNTHSVGVKKHPVFPGVSLIKVAFLIIQGFCKYFQLP